MPFFECLRSNAFVRMPSFKCLRSNAFVQMPLFEKPAFQGLGFEFSSASCHFICMQQQMCHVEICDPFLPCSTLFTTTALLFSHKMNNGCLILPGLLASFASFTNFVIYLQIVLISNLSLTLLKRE